MSKIVSIGVTSLEYVLPKGKAYGNARGLNNRRMCSLIELRTDDGVIGHGDASGPLGVVREYIKLLAPFFVGQDIHDFPQIEVHVRNRLYHFGSQGHFISALGGIDIAVHDALGKIAGLPVCKVLGGMSSQSVACYATTGYFTDDPKGDIREQLVPLAPGMFRGVKIKIGAGPESDVERVRAAREVLGEDILLMVDMNGNYTVDVALESLKRIAPYNIHWCEEPLPPADIQGYAELRKRSAIALAAGEAHYGVHDFKRLIEARAIDIAQPSIVGGGGFHEMRAVVGLAAMNNIRVSPPCWGSAVALYAALHFAASLPSWPHTDNPPFPLLIEYDVGDNPLRDRLVTKAIEPEDGHLAVPVGPGLGLALNSSTIERYKLPAT